MVDFDEKDYICCCKKEGQKYNFFCYNCKKNLCLQCMKDHDNHEIINLFNEFQFTKEYIV